MSADPATLDASAALALLRSGALTAESLARACLARVLARDAEVRAWTRVDADHVLAQARECDRLGAAGPATMGPLHGLPIGIKDVILTRDLPTQYNSPLYRGFHPAMDAACVTTLRAAGAIVFGKTDTVEFAATGRRALTRNPHDLSRTPGASSSGSAAAVADGHVPFALGTQTGGSIVRPAAYCGVWAMKPTWGLVDTEGVRHYAPSLDTLGWFARSAADLALMHDVFDGGASALESEPPAAVPSSVDGLRIAVCRTPGWSHAELPMQDALTAFAARLTAQGATVVALDLPPPCDQLAEAQRTVMQAEGRASFLAESRAFPGRLEASLQAQADNRHGISRLHLRDAYDLAAHCRTAFDAAAAPFDAVLAPSAVGEAPVGLSHTGDHVFNGLWTLLHVPCINVPVGHGPHGMPLGLTLTAGRFEDRRLLAVAAVMDKVLRGG